jgi:hypothetical protein
MSFMLLGILNSQAAGGGGAGAFDLLESETLSSNSASITFSNLGAYSEYKHLQIRMTAIGAAGFYSSGYLQFNGDATSSYSYHWLNGGGGYVAPTSSGASGDTSALIFRMIPDNDYPLEFAPHIIDIADFSSSTKNTTFRAIHGIKGTGTSNITWSSGAYHNTAAITSITLGGAGGNSIGAGSRFTLIGVK